jgi:hypothetical protein
MMSVQVSVVGRVDLAPAEAYRRLADFERYPAHAETVRSVELFERDSAAYSRWRVDFRGGVLCWTERDDADPVNLRLDFEQVDGDLDRFVGGWSVDADGSGSRLVFTAELDLGIPSLAPLVDPIAREALRGNIRSILSGLFADVRLTVDGAMASTSA